MNAPSGPPAPGPYIQTSSGRWFNPFEPDPEQIDPGDIARALANVCRFGGHTRAFYSVAQHSVIVSELVEERGGDVEDVFAALMHDATEAYLGDMPHPIKHRSPLGAAFKEAEDRLEAVLRRALRDQAGRAGDQARRPRAAGHRAAAFSSISWDWPELEGVERARARARGVAPDEAARRFSERYARARRRPR